MKVVGMAVAMALLGTTLPATSANLGFLKDTPISRFNKADMDMLNATLDLALESSPDGTASEWKNEKTGSSGTITPQKSLETGGKKCREVLVVNQHKTLKGEGTYTLCRVAEKKWVLSR